MANVNDLYKASFGQYGSAFTDNSTTAITPDTGMIICAITFLHDTGLSALVAEDDINASNESFGLTASHTGAGAGGLVIAAANIFPKGMTIFGRWTSVTTTTNGDAGIICYFSPK